MTSEIRTGIDDLDRDLAAILELARSEQLGRAATALNEKDISPDELLQIFPYFALRIAYTLADKDSYEQIKSVLPDELHQVLDEAKAIVDENFPAIRANSTVSSILSPEIDSTSASRPSPLAQGLNVVTRVQHLSSWVIGEDLIRPAIRFGLSNKSDRLLLDMTLDWDDVIFLIDSLSTALLSDMQSGQKIMKSSELSLDIPETYQKAIGDRLIKIQQDLEKVAKLAPQYGIEIKAP